MNTLCSSGSSGVHQKALTLESQWVEVFISNSIRGRRMVHLPALTVSHFGIYCVPSCYIRGGELDERKGVGKEYAGPSAYSVPPDEGEEVCLPTTRCRARKGEWWKGESRTGRPSGGG